MKPFLAFIYYLKDTPEPRAYNIETKAIKNTKDIIRLCKKYKQDIKKVLYYYLKRKEIVIYITIPKSKNN